MTDVSDYDIPFNELEARVMAWVTEALELRHGTAGDPDGRLRDAATDTMEEVQNLLLRARQRSDRVDELLANATRARGRARRAKEEAAFQADNAVNRATTVRAANRVEFSAGREREAEAKLDAFDERRAAHLAERLVSVTAEAYDVVNQIHWQLDAFRKDLRAQLHALQFESSLER